MSDTSLLEKWESVLNEQEFGSVRKDHQAAVAVMLENQTAYINEEATNVTGGVAKWDPVLIGMVRRSVPKMLAFDLVGVQPMTMPSGLVFAMRSRYTNQAGSEALFHEADPTFSGIGPSPIAGSIFGGDFGGTTGTDPATISAMLANIGEQLGSAGATQDFQEMAFSIEKSAVAAKTRGLRASWSVELEQDLKAVHGMNADEEMVNILSLEITNEINRELLRKMYFFAKLGAQNCTTPGKFNLQADSNGRWLVEEFKGLLFQVEIEANTIAAETRMGKGNFVVCSSNIASALAMTGLLDNVPTSQLATGATVDPTASAYVGTILNGMAVYVDPYGYEASAGAEFLMVGYKGASATQSGMFYCPYQPLTLARVVQPNSFQPQIGFKTRYGMTINPFAYGSTPLAVADMTTTADYTAAYRGNRFYRIFQVVGLK